MAENHNYNIALLGVDILTLNVGLLAARRDIRVVGIYPGPLLHHQRDPQNLHDLDVVAQYSTLCLGCPVFNDASELTAQSNLVLVSADIMSDNAPDMSKHEVIYLRHNLPEDDSDAWEKYDFSGFDGSDRDSVTSCQKARVQSDTFQDTVGQDQTCQDTVGQDPIYQNTSGSNENGHNAPGKSTVAHPTIYFQASNASARDHFRELCAAFTNADQTASDAGILNWRQGYHLLESLFDPKMKN